MTCCGLGFERMAQPNRYAIVRQKEWRPRTILRRKAMSIHKGLDKCRTLDNMPLAHYRCPRRFLTLKDLQDSINQRRSVRVIPKWILALSRRSRTVSVNAWSKRSLILWLVGVGTNLEAAISDPRWDPNPRYQLPCSDPKLFPISEISRATIPSSSDLKACKHVCTWRDGNG